MSLCVMCMFFQDNHCICNHVNRCFDWITCKQDKIIIIVLSEGILFLKALELLYCKQKNTPIWSEVWKQPHSQLIQETDSIVSVVYRWMSEVCLRLNFYKSLLEKSTLSTCTLYNLVHICHWRRVIALFSTIQEVTFICCWVFFVAFWVFFSKQP